MRLDLWRLFIDQLPKILETREKESLPRIKMKIAGQFCFLDMQVHSLISFMVNSLKKNTKTEKLNDLKM